MNLCETLFQAKAQSIRFINKQGQAKAKALPDGDAQGREEADRKIVHPEEEGAARKFKKATEKLQTLNLLYLALKCQHKNFFLESGEYLASKKNDEPEQSIDIPINDSIMFQHRDVTSLFTILTIQFYISGVSVS